MKKILLSLFCFIFAVGIIAQDSDAEMELIKKVVVSAYVDGIHNVGDIEKIDAGFHPGFNLLGVGNDNTLWKYPIYNWKESVNKRLSEGKLPKADEDLITYKFPLIDITGNAAIVKIELFEKDKMIYTDYLSLYKIEDDWKIVAKIFHSHK
jgi:Putative lumazine-binding